MSQLWVTDSLGGYMYSDNLSQKLRILSQPEQRFRQFADIKDAAHQGLNKGDTFHWNVYLDIATQGTTLVETTTMPESNFTIVQGTMTVTEAGNSVPYTGKLDALSEQPVTTIIKKVLKNDAKKAFDNLAYNQFNATPLRIVPTSGTATDAVTLTTNGTATATNNVAMGKEHIKAIVDLMKERNIPTYHGDDYVVIGWPTTFRTVKNNLESIHQYVESGVTRIMRGELGRYENVRFVEQTHVAKAGWTNAKSDWAFFFGDDTVAEAIAIPEEMRGKIPTDYGRSRGVAWYYLGGFGIVQTNVTNARILKWDSVE